MKQPPSEVKDTYQHHESVAKQKALKKATNVLLSSLIIRIGH
jgi:hypothetical protein